MKGNPKFKYGDKVQFEVDGIKKVGTVEIIDRYGTFFDDSDVSYDVMVIEENPILYKHVNERFVSLYTEDT